MRGSTLGSFAEANGPHLRERPYRFGQTSSDGDDAGNRGGTDGAKANEQHTELAASGSDFDRSRHGQELYISHQPAVASPDRVKARMAPDAGDGRPAMQ